MNTVRKDNRSEEEHHIHRIRDVDPHIQDAIDKGGIREHVT
jgi:hypothetical protein